MISTQNVSDKSQVVIERLLSNPNYIWRIYGIFMVSAFLMLLYGQDVIKSDVFGVILFPVLVVYNIKAILIFWEKLLTRNEKIQVKAYYCYGFLGIVLWLILAFTVGYVVFESIDYLLGSYLGVSMWRALNSIKGGALIFLVGSLSLFLIGWMHGIFAKRVKKIFKFIGGCKIF